MKKEIVLLFSVCLVLLIDTAVADVVTGGVITGEAVTGKATEGRVNASITFYDLVNFTIVYPENTTYSFSTFSNISLDLNVSWNGGNPTNWTFTLVDLWLNVTINSSAPFTPNTTIYPNTRSHNLTVTVQNEIGVFSVRSVVFYVDVNNTVPVIDIADTELFVCEDGQLNYYFNVSDAEDGGITVDLSPLDPFFIYPQFFIGSFQTINLYSLVLEESYVGTHELNISAADDFSSDSKSLNVTVIETNSYPTVENIGVATVWVSGENTTYYEEVSVFDAECDCDQTSGNFIFNLTYVNGSESFFNISQYGVMSFEANESLLGPDNQSITYNMTLCVSDQGLSDPHENISLCNQTGGSLTVCKNFSITVTAENRAPEIVAYYPLSLNITVPGTQEVYFNVSEIDLDGTIPDTYWYISSELIESDFGSSFDEFAYTFGCGVSGSRSIYVETTDGSSSCYGGGNCNDSLQWTVMVDYVACSSPGGGEGGGGGGGGGGGAGCIESWACNVWWTCENAEGALLSGELSGDDYRMILDECTAQRFDGGTCGYQRRTCVDINSCGTEVARPSEMQACYFTTNPSCFDGIKNCHDGSCEFMTDCGGSCDPCPTCSDGKQNQAEEGVDCGGPCPNACHPELPAQPKRLGVVYLFIALILLAILAIKLYRMLLIGGFLRKKKKEDEKG